MDLGVASVYFTVQTDCQLEKAVEFYTSIGLRIVSRFNDSINLHLFASELSSLTISIQIDPLSILRQPLDINQSTFTQLKTARILNLALKNYHIIKSNLMSLDIQFVDHHDFTFMKDPLNNMISLRQLVRVDDDDAVEHLDPPNSAHINILKSQTTLDSTLSLVAEPKRCIGILTSGGDSSGMNAAVRAITRYALQR